MTNQAAVNDRAFQVHLQSLTSSAESEMTRECAQIILDNCDDRPTWFIDYLSREGCVSGMVNELIWHKDTHAFFDRHYDEIECLREELQDNFGAPMKVNGDLKNFFAWLAFEETAFTIARDFGLEL